VSVTQRADAVARSARRSGQGRRSRGGGSRVGWDGAPARDATSDGHAGPRGALRDALRDAISAVEEGYGVFGRSRGRWPRRRCDLRRRGHGDRRRDRRDRRDATTGHVRIRRRGVVPGALGRREGARVVSLPWKVDALAQPVAKVTCGGAAEAQAEEARQGEGCVEKVEHGRLEGEVRAKLSGTRALEGGRLAGEQRRGRPLNTTLLSRMDERGQVAWEQAPRPHDCPLERRRRRRGRRGRRRRRRGRRGRRHEWRRGRRGRRHEWRRGRRRVAVQA
jgi:hypothetical protein